MRAVWIGVPESFLEERRRLGQDTWDELWEGVLHMVPPPSFVHGVVAARLCSVLQRIADRRGLVVTAGGGLYAADKDYRVPDIAIGRAEQASKRGFDTAELVIEVLSPDDENRDKLPFYASRAVREVWLIDPATRALEIHELAGTAYRAVPFERGLARSAVLAIELRVVNGTLELRDGVDVAVV